jgi:hypothetical protein
MGKYLRYSVNGLDMPFFLGAEGHAVKDCMSRKVKIAPLAV